MPNKAAKIRKQKRHKLNQSLKVNGRTKKQIKKIKEKRTKNAN